MTYIEPCGADDCEGECARQQIEEARRTSDGGYVVPVDSLEVGDRLRFSAGRGRPMWWPILAITESPKTRSVEVGIASSGHVIHRMRMRRTTLVARAPRKDEIA